MTLQPPYVLTPLIKLGCLRCCSSVNEQHELRQGSYSPHPSDDSLYFKELDSLGLIDQSLKEITGKSCHSLMDSVRKSSPRTIEKPRTQLKLDQRQPICVLGCNQSFVVWSWSWSWLPGFWGDTGPVATGFFGCTATLPYMEGGPYVCGNLQVYTNHFGGHTTHISKKFNFYQLI